MRMGSSCLSIDGKPANSNSLLIPTCCCAFKHKTNYRYKQAQLFPSRVPGERYRSGFAALVPELAQCPKGPGVRGTKVRPELSSESPGALDYGGSIYSRELQELKEVRGRGWDKARGARAQSPGCRAASLLSKCNKSNKVSLQPLAQAASKGTLLPRTLPKNEWHVNSPRPRGSGGT